MQIILASAKIMNDWLKSAPNVIPTVPRFQHEAEAFAKDMAGYSTETIAEMLNCSQQIASQNKLRFMRFFEDGTKLPAILAYNGQAYKHLKAAELSNEDLSFAQNHLWITSFLYGLLRPLDDILPYRMEGNVELTNEARAEGKLACSMPCKEEEDESQWPSADGQNMFAFWRSRLTDLIIDSVKADDGVLVHLATEEYQHLFDWQRVCQEVRVIQPMFYVRKGSDLKIQAVWAKTCRGAMTRFIIENRITNPEDLNAWTYEGFEYNSNYGEANYPHFIRQ